MPSNIASLAAVGSCTLAVGSEGSNQALFSISGTYGTVTAVIEGYDGTAWQQLAAFRKKDNVWETTTISPADNATLSWIVDFGGLTQVRFRVTAIASGTVIVEGQSFFGGSPPAGSNYLLNTPVIGGIGAAQPGSQALSITTSGAYVAGDGVGGIISMTTVNFSTGRRVRLRSVQINDKGNAQAALDIYFFKATPAAGTYTDNSPLVWGAGDSANKVGQLKVQTGDWVSDGSQCSVNYGLDMKMAVAATTLFMLIVLPTGSAPTFTNGNLKANLEFDQE